MKKTLVIFAVLIGIGAIGNLLPDSGGSYETTVISREDQKLVNECVARGNEYATCYKGYNKLAK